MSNETPKDQVDVAVTGTPEVQDAKVESVQAVVDRVRSWQQGAPVETVRAELVAAFGKAGLDVPAEVDEIAADISAEHRVEVDGA